MTHPIIIDAKANIHQEADIASGHEAHRPLRPWSIRGALKHLASQRIAISESLSDSLPSKPTVAQRVAAAAFDAAIHGNMKAIQFVTDQIDGKIWDNRMHEDFLAIQAMSDEELLEFIAQPLLEKNQ